MKMSSYIQRTGGIKGRGKLLPVLIVTLIAVTCFLNPASAQKNNLSDWHVPPPLPPGSITKGATTGKSATGKPVILTLSDVPAASLPAGPAVKLPMLAAISTTSPLVNSPDQPIILGVDAGLPEIPLPGAPDAAPLPKQSYQDTQIPAGTDLPVPAAPEMPAFPPEPTPTGQTTGVKASIPLTPDVVSLLPFSLHAGGGLVTWSTPGITENISFKLKVPAEEKGIRHSGKAHKKLNSAK